MAVLAPEQTRTPGEPPRRTPVPRRRLERTPPLPGDRRLSWVLTAVLGLLTLAVRLVGISYPKDLVFDEAYYPPEAHDFLVWGHEYNRGYTFIVHPPLGKIIIAGGEWLFGDDSLGWRVPSAVAGTLAVVVLVRLARRLTGSTFFGVLAGLLLALDGFSFSLARIGLLDVFLQFFIVAAVACLVVDRDVVRQRVREGADRMTDTGFRLGPRGWRIAAGVLFGCACGVKWSGIYFLVLFALLSLVWDRTAWREAGATRPALVTLRRGVPGAAWALALLPLLTYLATFTGWFRGESAQDRFWAAQHPDTKWPWVPDALRSLWHMHAKWLAFHDSLSSPHPWQSNPWSWLVDGRPILLWNPQGLKDAAGDQVIRYIIMVGTPTLWFLFVPALVWSLWRLVARRDPAAAVVLVSFVAGWATWLVNLDRTMFIFYIAPTVPFLVLGITMVLQDVLGPRDAPVLRRQIGLGAVCLYVAVVAVTFAFFYPVLVGHPLSYSAWIQRMWFPSWF
jgi:dolichyl-phosphate-mannose-protein mannosyltransferase